MSKEDEALIAQGELLLETYEKTQDTILLGQMFTIWTSLSKIDNPQIGFRFDDCSEERIRRIMDKLASVILQKAQSIVF